ncbi:fungal-specific transcription factor domain-containing protein [Trichoderma barbatum]
MDTKKHVTTACRHCRRRKIKCDGRSPCANCNSLKQSCIYNPDDDKRRVSIKKSQSALAARLAQLEGTLQAHNIALPPAIEPQESHNRRRRANARPSSSPNPLNASSDDATSNIADAPQSPHPPPKPPTLGSPPPIATQDSVAVTTRSVSFPENALFDKSSVPNEPAYVPLQNTFCGFTPTFADDGTDGFDFNLPLDADSPPSPGLTYAPVLPDPPPAPDDITNSLAARVGALQIAEDGQLRYYGPTSNLHLYHSGLQSLSRSTIRHVATEGEQALRRAGLGQRVDPEVEMRLAQLYFTWEDPAIHVIDEEIFYLEKQKSLDGVMNTPYYSETLNNAICAIGANLASGEQLGVPEPAPEFFSARAKALLDVEMDSPSVATVQALVIMSASEAAFTRDARGYLYSGMAVRLSADLGLHLDLTEHYRNGILTQRDIDVRRTTFWGVFIHDNMWSLYMGRPWGISIRDISVSRPLKELDSVRQKMWSPTPPKVGDRSVMALEGAMLDPLEACTDANITLCEFMRRINRTLYAGRNVGADEMVEFLSRTRKELWDWMDNLPEELRINLAVLDKVYIPHVLQLHMQFYTLVIFLFRPYFSRDILRWTQSMSHEGRSAVATVRTDCISAAHRLVEVLRCFRKQHSLRYTNIQIVHLIFTGSLVHIYNACTCSPSESQTALDDLQFCCQSLGEIGQTYGNATRALEVIILVKREWQRLAAVRNAKRPGSSIYSNNSTTENSRQKRRSPSSAASFGPLNPPQFMMPSAFETFRVPIDSMRQAPLPGIPKSRQEMYDAWQFLNWNDPNVELVGTLGGTGQMEDQPVPPNPDENTIFVNTDPEAGHDPGADAR